MPTEWYEVVEGYTLETGDIIRNCRIHFPVLPENPDDDVTKVDFVEYDVIVMSQTCDLVEGRVKLDQVVLCPIFTKSIIDQQRDPPHALAEKKALERAAQNKEPAFFVMQACDHHELTKELSVVHFRQIYTLPVETLRRIAVARKKRLRLRSPYREALANRFASFFSRVGFPEDIRLPD